MPDFGSFRGFGEKLVQGQTPTQLGKIGSVNVFDVDAVAFFDRVTTSGGSLTLTEQSTVNQLVVDLKGYSIWSKMKAIYPMVGASAAACAQNLKSSSFTGTFFGGITYASTGITPNGTSGYMNTAFNPSTNSSLNSGSIGAYINNGTTGSTIMGAVVTSPPSATQLIPTDSGTIMYGDIHDSSLSGTSNTIKNAFFQASRINSTQKIHGVNTTITTISGVSTSLTNLNIYIGARNVNGSYSSGYSSRIALIYIGDGLTTTEMTNYYTAVQAFQTALSRQV